VAWYERNQQTFWTVLLSLLSLLLVARWWKTSRDTDRRVAELVQAVLQILAEQVPPSPTLAPMLISVGRLE